MFDDVHHVFACEVGESEWLRTTFFSALHFLVELFDQFQDSTAHLVPEVICIHIWFCRY